MTDWLEHEVGREYHPVAALFPLMEGAEFEELKADIATNGLLEAIWIDDDGQVLDGRNRHRACIETETQPEFRTWSGSGSLVSFVVSMNLHRRHLSSSQRGMIATDALRMLEEEAEQRRLATLKQGARYPDKEIVPEREHGQARDQAAAMFQTNPRYVQDAKRIRQEAPDLADDIRRGDKTIPQAKRELVRRYKKDPPPLPDDLYRVWYADPPWEYGNSGVIGEHDNYGHVGRHYPSMTIAELCEMGGEVKARCATDAVLFLWVTSPLLEECFPVIRAWGFRYKTSFVWDKVRHNYGHYNSVRHELLLICTRGSCTPDNVQLFDSVQTIERSDRHSEKPAEFRTIIETLYPHGKRIELFARGKYDGWDGWGNEGA